MRSILRVGDVGRAPLWRAPGRRPILGEPLARGLPRAPAARRSDGPQPDTSALRQLVARTCMPERHEDEFATSIRREALDLSA
jgi:hypothetical protein